MDTTKEILQRYQSANENVRLSLFMNHRELRKSFREIDRSTELVVPRRSHPTLEFSWKGAVTFCWKRLTEVVAGR